MHAIRLRAPWRFEPLADRVRYRRAFGCPTGLGPRERVWIVVEGMESAIVLLNDERLGTAQGAEPARFEVTGKLAPRNELVLEVKQVEPSAGLRGEVRIEIQGGERAG